MVANQLKEKRGDDRGQALFEFIIFLPFLLFFVTVMFTIGNAINGSINQQKAARRYFFYIYKGNSTIPDAGNLNILAEDGLQKVGAVSVGWREKDVGKDSFATCYRLATFLGKGDDDDCDKPSLDEGRSNFVRIFTMFGLCGETYRISDGTIISDYFGRSFASGCTLQ